MKRPLRTLFYGMSHEHAPGKIATLRTMADDFDIVAVVDDRPRRSPSFFTFPFDATGFRVVSEEEACSMDGIDVVFVETANRDLCPIERFDGKNLTLTLSSGDIVSTMDFGVQTDRYADQLRDLAAIVRGDKPNDQDYDRDLKTHEMTLMACGLTPVECGIVEM